MKSICSSKNFKKVKTPAAAAKSLQSCPTLCDPRDGSPPGPAVPRILQAGGLEWGATAFSLGEYISEMSLLSQGNAALISKSKNCV